MFEKGYLDPAAALIRQVFIIGLNLLMTQVQQPVQQL